MLILFLDVKGIFLNAVPARLIHNLHKRRIPSRHANFISGMLEGRTTFLRFDNHISSTIKLDNGIGQGDPLSMVLYQFYNADILDIPFCKNKVLIAYVNNALILAMGKDFYKIYDMLVDMMTREGSIYNWTLTHNSPIEHSKLALIDFAHPRKDVTRPDLKLPSITISPIESTRYLEIILDQHLN